ncbi:tRNA nucleotidyltransferase (CCA-adding enzyme) [Desulfitispora alkaliphila]|uniref:CBS domain-containing protein n=1 Tax=Desulfitispora alkaliphila TaxID=622674 RepID=UPI003D1D526C
MQIITSHLNLDFDGLASMVAAGKLYPKAKLVLPDKLSPSVKEFLALYRDSISLYTSGQIDWSVVNKAILVDTANLERIGTIKKHIQDAELIVYDHHHPSENTVAVDKGRVEPLGATVTILTEEIVERGINISSFEATIMALGLYTDTGSLSYINTTPRDLRAGSYLLEWGANLAVVAKFSERSLIGEQQELFSNLVQNSREISFKGIDIAITTHQQEHYQGGLAVIARKIMEVTAVDGLFLVVRMGNKTWIVGRSDVEQLDVTKVMSVFGGGGHPKAASATVKEGKVESLAEQVEKLLDVAITPVATVVDIMSSPVKTVAPDTKIEDVAKILLRYGHTGLPVVEGEDIVGIISRRDVDKASHHGLSHAPVKGFMSKEVRTIGPRATIEEVQNMMIEYNVGRLPVCQTGKLVGIISRSDVLSYIHGENVKGAPSSALLTAPIEENVHKMLEENIPSEIYHILQAMGREADQWGESIYLVGGIVRDLILGCANEDVDVVVEGDGIRFANRMAEKMGGRVASHEKFGTATWKTMSGQRIDISTARREFYDYPAALPQVERCNLKEDLYRRDFTINAMAIQLNTHNQGRLIDHFHGCLDLRMGKVRVLYNLSFVEDPTRILRAVRFEHRYGFRMDLRTLELALDAVDLISSVSHVRIGSELKVVLNQEKPLEAIRRLEELGIWNYLIGEGFYNQQAIKRIKILENILKDIEGLKNVGTNKWICYLAVIFYPHPQWIEKLKNYVLSKTDSMIVQNMEKIQVKWNNINDCGVDWLEEMHTNLREFCPMSIAVLSANSDNIDSERVLYYLKRREYFKMPISGSDLMEMGLEPGPLYSQIMKNIEGALLRGEVNDKETAIAWIKERYS